ncbi:hypothetical protein Zmor_023585 [Zophobas morio]|uniref:Uncharacterized protein n=1 Tax=Zophobas morio TaxID=2755281 RepID=A0AA38M7I2_9CUCU|nr:hypothetical protein Zmor_023585 [Zophobas morio]
MKRSWTQVEGDQKKKRKLNGKSGMAKEEIDYYWRDFRGKIPPDAIEGGMTASGTPFYVAQVYIKKYGLLPATVFRNKPEAVANAHGKKLETTENIKVLCSKNKNNFKWVSIRSEDLNLLTNTHLVVGGSEGDQVLYIGRAFDDGSTVLGKIFKHNLRYKGLWVPSQEHERMPTWLAKRIDKYFMWFRCLGNERYSITAYRVIKKNTKILSNMTIEVFLELGIRDFHFQAFRTSLGRVTNDESPVIAVHPRKFSMVHRRRTGVTYEFIS